MGQIWHFLALTGLIWRDPVRHKRVSSWIQVADISKNTCTNFQKFCQFCTLHMKIYIQIPHQYIKLQDRQSRKEIRVIFPDFSIPSQNILKGTLKFGTFHSLLLLFALIPLHNQCIEHFSENFRKIVIFGLLAKCPKISIPRKNPIYSRRGSVEST